MKTLMRSRRIDPVYWKGRRVFITGHMGFKGAWLCSLLERFGAITIGFGKDDRSHLLYRELSLKNHHDIVGDINDLQALERALIESEAEIVIHLAAQPLVLASYADPVSTFETNVMGTVKLLESARRNPSLKALVMITTDKVYLNNEWDWAYRESDMLGGADPYSASKAACELAVGAMAKSFFSKCDSPNIATARAGNVIGGGDWAKNRLLPDAAKALGSGRPLICRNPHSIRPWQHVLDALAGYLLLAESLDSAASDFPTAWNFGPSSEDAMTVGSVADIFADTWGLGAEWRCSDESTTMNEATHLAIDSTLARNKLCWRPRWTAHEAVSVTANWYHAYSKGINASTLVNNDIDLFFS